MDSKRTRCPLKSALLWALGSIFVVAARVGAQNLPPPGAYQPIPNFTGVGAGLQFREAINNRLSGTQPISPSVVAPTFVNLPSEQDGQLLYCADCKRATPCVNGGSGAWALGSRGQWSCGPNALESSLNANGNKITALANGQSAGDAISFGQTGAQLNTLAGIKLDGSDAISNMSVNGVYNVRGFGAKGDCVTDDWQAIENAIFAACNASASGGGDTRFNPSVYLPPTPNSCYLVSFPVWATCGNSRYVTIEGASSMVTTLEPAGYFPAMFVSQPAWANATGGPLGTITASPLVGSTGKALNFNHNESWGVNLKSILALNGSGANAMGGQYGAAAFNGMGSWTVEFWFDVNGTTNGQIGNFIASLGGDQTSAPNNGSNPDEGLLTVQYTVAGGGTANTMRISANLSGGVKDINPSAITFTSNAVHYLAVTYNGSSIQTYLDGTRYDNVSASGTVRDAPAVDMFYGVGIAGFPAGLQSGDQGGMYGQLDSLRISNTARYTGSTMTVPTSKNSCDANTVVLINGTQVLPSRTINGVATTMPFLSPECVWGGGTSNSWTPIWYEIATTLQQATIEHLQFAGGTIGLLLGNTIASRFSDLYFQGQSWNGIDIFNNCYEDYFQNFRFNVATYAQEAANFNWGGNLIESMNAPGAGYYGIVDGQGGNHYIDPFVQAGSNNLGGLVLAKAGTIYSSTVVDHYVDDNEESAVGPVIIVNANNTITFNGGSGDQGGQSVSPVQIGGNTWSLALNLNGFGFDSIGTSGPPPIFNFTQGATGSLRRAVYWRNPRINGLPWSKNQTATNFPLTGANGAGEVFIEADNAVTIPALASAAVGSVTYGATVTPDLRMGVTQEVIITDGNAWTLANPLNNQPGSIWFLDVFNNSGGTGGAISYGSNYKKDSTCAGTAPANGKRQRWTITNESANVALVTCSGDM